MNRRTLLRTAALSAAATGLRLRADSPQPADIKQVVVAFKCHLDVGFSATQRSVVSKYFNTYYPQAIATAQQLHTQGGDRYTWTTGSWLLYTYLEQATAPQRKAMEEAISNGDIAWHALPFSWQTELLDRSLIEGSLGFSATLDKRFGKQTIAAKMTDVPGHSRGIISPLAAAGVKLLDIGVNAASTAPDVPDLFIWQDPAGAEIIMAYHRLDYGGTILVPGSSTAFSMQVRGDNSGPHSPAEIAAIYAKLRGEFPNAKIQAANLSEVAAAIDPYRSQLPVIKEEIGDTWIHGISSDPPKLAQYRELMRLRKQWITDKKISIADAVDLRFLQNFLLAAEHTWGTDTKTYLDYNHYRPSEIAEILQESNPGYKTMEASWQEKRDDITRSVASLPPQLQGPAVTALQRIEAQEISTETMRPTNSRRSIEGEHFIIGIDSVNGSIVQLISKQSQRDYASPTHPLAFFTYQTLDAKNFADFIALYIHSTEDWAYKDFGKPNIDHFHANYSEWHPRLVRLSTSYTAHVHRIVAELVIDDARSLATGNVAWPQQLALEIEFPDAEPVIHLKLVTLNKLPNRLPESMWLTFNPPVAPGPTGWSFDKVEQTIAPQQVIRNGNRTMHAVTTGIRYEGPGGQGSLSIETLDSPLIALGARTPLNFAKELPQMHDGIHINLFNNAWGTNYPQWAGGDWLYRFTLKAT